MSIDKVCCSDIIKLICSEIVGLMKERHWNVGHEIDSIRQMFLDVKDDYQMLVNELSNDTDARRLYQMKTLERIISIIAYETDINVFGAELGSACVRLAAACCLTDIDQLLEHVDTERARLDIDELCRKLEEVTYNSGFGVKERITVDGDQITKKIIVYSK
jgi:hypothetical protein